MGVDYYSYTLIGMIPLTPDIQQAKTKLKEFLEPYGLWDENEFGIWSILHYSY